MSSDSPNSAVTLCGSAGSLGFAIAATAAEIPGATWLTLLGVVASAAVPVMVAYVNRAKDDRLAAEKLANAETLAAEKIAGAERLAAEQLRNTDLKAENRLLREMLDKSGAKPAG